MKLTEELLKEMEKKKELYGDGIIMPDGDYRLIQDGHLKTLMALLPYTENEIWKMIPEDDSALFWLVEKTRLRADRCQFRHWNENDPRTAENLRSTFQPWDRL